jgi:hypothetical protein
MWSGWPSGDYWKTQMSALPLTRSSTTHAPFDHAVASRVIPTERASRSRSLKPPRHTNRLFHLITNLLSSRAKRTSRSDLFAPYGVFSATSEVSRARGHA